MATEKKPKERSPNWGGKREGAGRPPSGNPPRFPYCVKVNEEEKQAIRKLLDKMRSKKKPKTK